MARKSKYAAERTEKILNFINDFREDHDYGPSLSEIGRHIGVKSTSLIIFYLKKLEASGRIERDRKISRSIRVTGQSQIK